MTGRRPSATKRTTSVVRRLTATRPRAETLEPGPVASQHRMQKNRRNKPGTKLKKPLASQKQRKRQIEKRRKT